MSIDDIMMAVVCILLGFLFFACGGAVGASITSDSVYENLEVRIHEICIEDKLSVRECDAMIARFITEQQSSKCLDSPEH